MPPAAHDSPPPDPEVPALAVLLGPEARDVIAVALAEAAMAIRSLEVRQVRYVPGRSVTAHFRVGLVPSDGVPDSVTVVASSGVDMPDNVPRVGSGDIEISLFRYPHDPMLPGLALADDAVKVRRLLVELGGPDEPCRTRLRAYRAMRRAVVEVEGGGHRFFLKVVRPTRTRGIQARHEALAGTLPVPHSLGWSEEQGIVVLQAMPGATLRAAIGDGNALLPPPTAIVGLLTRLDEADVPLRRVEGPHEIVRQHTRLVGAVVPGLRQRLDALVAAVEQLDAEPEVAVHGDFHASQVLVDGAEVVGLVDVDTAGRGERSSDFASMLAQISVLASANPGDGFDRYGRQLIDVFDGLATPGSLRLKTAAAIVGLATGPFRVQEKNWRANTIARIELAERWVASAAPRRV